MKKIKNLGLLAGSLALMFSLTSCNSNIKDTFKFEKNDIEKNDVIVKYNNNNPSSSASVDTVAPVINTSEILVNKDDPFTIEEVLSKINITDDVSSKDNIKLELLETDYAVDEYGNINQGDFFISVKATDESGNSTEKTIDIFVNPKYYEFSYDSPSDLENLEFTTLKNFSYTNYVQDLENSFSCEHEYQYFFTDFNLISESTDVAYKLRYFIDSFGTSGHTRFRVVLYEYSLSDGWSEVGRQFIPTSTDDVSDCHTYLLFDSAQVDVYDTIEFDFDYIYKIVKCPIGWTEGELNDDGSIHHFSNQITSFIGDMEDVSALFLGDSNNNRIFKFRNKGDINAPIFDTIEGNYIVVDVNDIMSINDILAEEIIVNDSSDFDLKVLSTTYNPNNLKLGNHKFNVQASDVFGNSATQEYIIVVRDTEKPVIAGKNEYKCEYDNIISIEDMLSNLFVKDNFDKDLNVNFVKKSDSLAEGEIGAHSYLFNATDESGNVSDNFLVSVQVVDTQKPIIAMPSIIEVSDSYILQDEDISSLIYAYDSYDNTKISLDIDMTDYLNNYNNIGEYKIQIKCSDSSNNRFIGNLQIKVSDTLLTDIKTHKYAICFDKKAKITDEILLNCLQEVNQFYQEDVKFLKYDISNAVAGSYTAMAYMNDDSIYDFEIRIIDDYIETKESNSYWTNWKKIENWGTAQYLTIIGIAAVLYIALNYTVKKKR